MSTWRRGRWRTKFKVQSSRLKVKGLLTGCSMLPGESFCLVSRLFRGSATRQKSRGLRTSRLGNGQESWCQTSIELARRVSSIGISHFATRCEVPASQFCPILQRALNEVETGSSYSSSLSQRDPPGSSGHSFIWLWTNNISLTMSSRESQVRSWK